MKRSILIVNPNTTQSITDSLRTLVEALGYNEISFVYFTAPSGVPSINNEADAAISAQACLQPLRSALAEHDGFLICCYSHHPLVYQLRSEIKALDFTHKYVAGIFETSVATCLQHMNQDQKFGIVSTGSQWKDILGTAVSDLLGAEKSARYAGTETTELNADEMHTTPFNEVEKRMKKATMRLLDKDVKAICLGCAGMAGLDKMVRDACVEHSGADIGKRIKIVDGVVSGVNFLEGALRSRL